jgi:hypothetical protein
MFNYLLGAPAELLLSGPGASLNDEGEVDCVGWLKLCAKNGREGGLKGGRNGVRL